MPISALGMAGISAGFDLIGGQLGGILGNKRNEKAWRQQQEYNSPANQMARLKAAGLNPNLVYGSGNAITPASQPNVTNPDTSDIGSKGLQNYVSNVNLRMQNDLLEKQKEFIDMQIRDKQSMIDYRDGAQTDKYAADIDFTRMAQRLKEKEIGAFDTNTYLSQQKTRQETTNARSQNELVQQQIKNYPTELKWKINEARARIANLNANTDKQKIEAEMIKLAKEYRKQGIEVNDNIIFRTFHDVVGGAKGIMEDIFSIFKF